MARPSFVNKFRFKLLAGAMSAAAVIALPSVSFAVPSSQPQDSKAQELSIKDAAKKLGLDKPATKDFKYSKKTSKKDVFTLDNVKTEDGLEANKLVIDKQEQTGKVRITLTDGVITGDESFKFSKVTIVFDEISDGSAINNFITLSEKSDDSFKGDLSIENLETVDGDVPIKIGSLTVNGLESKGDVNKFRDIQLRKLESDMVVATLKLDQFDVLGVKDSSFDAFYSKDANSKNDFSKISWDKLQLKGLVVTPTEAARKASADTGNSFEGFNLANFEINGLGGKVLKRFAIEGLKLNGKMDNEDIVGNIGELSFDNFNLQYITTIIQYSLDPEKNADLGKKVLGDFLPYGPLGSAGTSVRYRDINFAGSGLKLTIDDMKLNSVLNAQNIITSLIMPKTNIDFTVTDSTKEGGKIVAEGFEKYGIKAINITTAGESTFDPVSDIVSGDNSYIEAKDIGKISYSAKIGGVQKAYNKATIKEVVELSVGADDLDGKDASPSEALGVITKALSFYKDMEIINANISIRDYGFINRAIIAHAASEGKKPKDVKDEWLKEFRANLKDKKATKSKKELSTAIIKFIEEGGAINITAAPPKPVKFDALTKENVKAEDFGISFTNSK